MPEPIILPFAHPGQATRPSGQEAITVNGLSFDIHEWSGSGPDYLHVHQADDEAWLVLDGTLTFKFADKEVEAPAGTFVFVPAGVAHSYYEAHGPTRYLIIMTPRVRQLIAALHSAPREQHATILCNYKSEIME